MTAPDRNRHHANSALDEVDGASQGIEVCHRVIVDDE